MNSFLIFRRQMQQARNVQSPRKPVQKTTERRLEEQLRTLQKRTPRERYEQRLRERQLMLASLELDGHLISFGFDGDPTSSEIQRWVFEPQADVFMVGLFITGADESSLIRDIRLGTISYMINSSAVSALLFTSGAPLSLLATELHELGSLRCGQTAEIITSGPISTLSGYGLRTRLGSPRVLVPGRYLVDY
jgi:hypothetical protein